jgi:hypothetical protein
MVQCWSLVNTAMNILVTKNSGNILTSWATIRFSRGALLHAVSLLVVNMYIIESFTYNNTKHISMFVRVFVEEQQ